MKGVLLLKNYSVFGDEWEELVAEYVHERNLFCYRNADFRHEKQIQVTRVKTPKSGRRGFRFDIVFIDTSVVSFAAVKEEDFIQWIKALRSPGRDASIVPLSWTQRAFQSMLRTLPVRAPSSKEGFEEFCAVEASKPPPELPTAVLQVANASLLVGAACRTLVLNTLNSHSQVTILYLHGGAFVSNVSPEHFDGLCALMSELGQCTVVVPIYPVAPASGHKDICDIVEAVYRQTTTTHKDQKIVLMGDCSGGGLVLSLAQRLATAKNGGDLIRQPDSVVLLSPWLDVSVSDSESAFIDKRGVDPYLSLGFLQLAGKALVNGANLKTNDPLVSPLFGALADLPPISLFTGTHDIVVPDSRRLRDRFEAEKIQSHFRYKEESGLLHCWWMKGGDEGAKTVREITSAIREDCGLESKSIRQSTASKGVATSAAAEDNSAL